MKKYREPLGILYKMYESFKVEFTAILNWPLMPTKFEAAWHELVAKYDLHSNNMMIQLWDARREWISAYFKEVFCARMASTQGSESMNYILKKRICQTGAKPAPFLQTSEQLHSDTVAERT